ncbi:hypoxanthine phosphoribosyltransferase [Alkaliphilus pronyensis]|uniref:Hypoxanthine phosphoribosyltransferase n=1 Tax=Alkaliphilus pronyensis TaxID=1482732 RepID=A0A6I0F7H9_9FIRM|nr:hypoxanthine phosphoribosyltransferase [Alkaliphilus pronyensis]KAB3538610.1 hypoxanthine phosphoribosyltransferase [Alkaliphilus pronyensis]
MKKDVEEILFTKDEIAKKVKEIGMQITKDYKDKNEILVVGVLKGANVFLGDLIREVNIPVYVDFMAVSSYGQSTESSGVVRIIKDLDTDIEGKHVIIVEDIVDTGLTLKYLTENLMSRKLESLKICALLDKPERRKCNISLDYIGFNIPDKFIVGYGIDYAERYRNLPYIAVLKEEAYQ